MIALGCDHGGFELKEAIRRHLEDNQVEYRDFGIYENKSVDYPEIANMVSHAVADGQCGLGILCCGTGIGMSIAANKVDGVRAACCSDYFSAKYTRLHNDANVLCLGGRVLGEGLALELVDVFLNTKFEGGRHQKRIEMLAQIEKGQL